MQCEICKQNEAAVHLKHAINGEVREVHLCSDCAAKNGFIAKVSPASLTDFLFGVETQRKAEAATPDVTCPNCHMRRSDFRKTSRFGCSTCYPTFAEELAPLLDEFQKGRKHVGKVPVSEKHAAALAELQRQLDAAVQAQNFEDAAKLRDAMQALKKDRKGRRRVAPEVVK